MNLNVNEKLQDLEKSGKLTPEIREAIKYAFAQGQEVGEQVGYVRGKNEVKPEQPKPNPTAPIFVEDRQNDSVSTSGYFPTDLIEFKLSIKRGNRGFQSVMSVTTELIENAVSPQELFGVVLDRIVSETKPKLTNDNIRRNLL